MALRSLASQLVAHESTPLALRTAERAFAHLDALLVQPRGLVTLSAVTVTKMEQSEADSLIHHLNDLRDGGDGSAWVSKQTLGRTVECLSELRAEVERLRAIEQAARAYCNVPIDDPDAGALYRDLCKVLRRRTYDE